MKLLEQRRLLVVDDELDLREIISEWLEPSLQIEVECAGDGFEALKMLQTGKFQAVLSDIRMPRMSGLELLREMRRLEIETPLVVLTGYGEKESVVEALRMGAFDFLEKPFDAQTLIGVVNRALEYGVRSERLVDTPSQAKERRMLKLLQRVGDNKRKAG